MARQLSFSTLLVLQALLDGDSKGFYGLELIALTGLASGTLYPILSRLEDRGWVFAASTAVQVGKQKRNRRYYRLTKLGGALASSETSALRRALRLVLASAAAESEVATGAGPIAAGEIEIRPDRFQVFVDGRSVDLTRREFELVQLMASADGRVLEREEIYARLWGATMVRGDRSIDVFVRKVRQKLEKASPAWRYIHTQFGIGYRFAAEFVEVVDPSDLPSPVPADWNPGVLRGG